jgi:hypothetical protein
MELSTTKRYLVSKGHNRVVVFPTPSPEDGNRSSFRNIVFQYLEFRTIDILVSPKPSSSECYDPSSDHFGFYLIIPSLRRIFIFVQESHFREPDTLYKRRRWCHWTAPYEMRKNGQYFMSLFWDLSFTYSESSHNIQYGQKYGMHVSRCSSKWSFLH